MADKANINDIQDDERTEMRMDLDSLSEKELEELSRIVVRKLRAEMRQERDRSGIS